MGFFGKRAALQWPRLEACGLALCFAFALVRFAGPASAFAETMACPGDAPIRQVGGVLFYTDKKASVADPQKVKQDAEVIRPLQMYLIHLAAILDAPAATPAALDCAVEMLNRWAAAGAMLTEPDNFEGVRERARFTIGLNIIALKLSKAGHPVNQATRDWLHSLSLAAVRDFASRPLKDNLYIWSGVDAASDAVLSGDASERNYASDVWRNGIEAINQNGTVATELARGSRALLYHQYYLSGLLMLRSFRQTLGDNPTPADQAKLKSLTDLVAGGLLKKMAVARLEITPKEATKPTLPPLKYETINEGRKTFN
jgi:poly(beta-D-mannuronate) lyase